MNEKWVTIISAVLTATVSIISVFGASFLGQKRYFKTIETNNKLDRYQKLYLPLLKILYFNSGPTGLNVFNIYKAQRRQTYFENEKNLQKIRYIPYQDPLVNLIMNNLQYAAPELLKRCLTYAKYVASIYWASNYDAFRDETLSAGSKNVQQTMKKIDQEVSESYNEESLRAIESFAPLVKEILLEAQKLATDLQSEDLTKPLSDSLLLGQKYSKRAVKALKEAPEFEQELKSLTNPFS